MLCYITSEPHSTVYLLSGRAHTDIWGPGLSIEQLSCSLAVTIEIQEGGLGSAD